MAITVSALKAAYQAQIAPGNDAEFLRILQEAEIRLCEMTPFRWTKLRVTLVPVDGIVSLPATCASIIGAQVNGWARNIWDETFEFSPDGPGEVPVSGGGASVLIDQGLDDTGARTYKVTGTLADDVSIIALCHKAPAILYDSDLEDDNLPAGATDTLTCPDTAAHKHIMLGIVMEEANEVEQSSKYFSIALKNLHKRESTFRGSARSPFNIRPNGPGIPGIPAFR